MAVMNRGNRGFTLIELLIVVAVIGIVAAIGGIQFRSYRVKCHNTASLEQLRCFKVAIESYYANNSIYP